ncbi:MAG: hypothetical protein ACTSQE_16570 [Candidatus Heimdallarchaeaceae archaeon]
MNEENQFIRVAVAIRDVLLSDFYEAVKPQSFEYKVGSKEVIIKYVVSEWEQSREVWSTIRNICMPFFWLDDDIEIDGNKVTQKIYKIDENMPNIPIKINYKNIKGEARFGLIQALRKEGKSLKEIAKLMDFEYNALCVWLTRNKQRYTKEEKLKDLGKIKKIMFREFQGENIYVFSIKIKDKNEQILIKGKKRKYLIDHQDFKKLVQLGERRRFQIKNEIQEFLMVFIVHGEFFIKDKKGKDILNMPAIINEKLAYEMILALQNSV